MAFELSSYLQNCLVEILIFRQLKYICQLSCLVMVETVRFICIYDSLQTFTICQCQLNLQEATFSGFLPFSLPPILSVSQFSACMTVDITILFGSFFPVNTPNWFYLSLHLCPNYNLSVWLFVLVSWGYVLPGDQNLCML